LNALFLCVQESSDVSTRGLQQIQNSKKRFRKRAVLDALLLGQRRTIPQPKMGWAPWVINNAFHFVIGLAMVADKPNRWTKPLHSSCGRARTKCHEHKTPNLPNFLSVAHALLARKSCCQHMRTKLPNDSPANSWHASCCPCPDLTSFLPHTPLRRSWCRSVKSTDNRS
jgi:hypothetical protein